MPLARWPDHGWHALDLAVVHAPGFVGKTGPTSSVFATTLRASCSQAA